MPGGSTPSTRGTAQTSSGSAITRRSTVIRLTTKPSSSTSRATARAAETRTTPVVAANARLVRGHPSLDYSNSPQGG
ncbi:MULTISPECIES: hypothetical protein [Streptomyces]|uniref:Uncharacterized protein n=1 Tax=Streptomyces mirabilis TaxID=68239 RepID=A0ABU3UBY1_9ACTN|nr:MULTISPECIES: hypothetical protein [Streptomyces]MCX4617092.1 hypothetical protein [Streptomyces mirabilis]MCX5355323.1 hypothetical protein [Streptomyces mirabilis]MDU8991104.1 hypothetical protein [Streptomyces mirabilis]QDN93044.1 hypothetical protein FNV61_53310 [Streptomyces sp. RLB3-6]QDO13865.1 hypothetical protein FNV68_54370 [Streptomyces sp. S1D4-23]